ncbi:MAG TPA: hypothetical protein VNT81_15045 [Vicinamibacterales bacterium]|nr:hypothetical protein [Vicinamibacterales bacterium]
MIRGFAFAMASVLSVTVLLATSAFAHPAHEQKVMGTVTMVAADHVMLKTMDGKDATVVINKDTKFTRAKKAMKASDMVVGLRVVIAAVTDENDEKLIAKTVELGPAPATKK